METLDMDTRRVDMPFHFWGAERLKQRLAAAAKVLEAQALRADRSEAADTARKLRKEAAAIQKVEKQAAAAVRRLQKRAEAASVKEEKSRVDAEAAESRRQLSSADAAPSRGARAQARAQGAWANPAHLISQLREGAETAVDAASPNVRPRQAPRSSKQCQ
jgi:hypothetical protein